MDDSIVKVAFFVEGQTELIFVEKLLKEYFGEKNLAIETQRMRGGSNSPITITRLSASNSSDETKYFVLITDCGGDTTVKSYVLDQRDSLIRANYSAIIGLLDLYPRTQEEFHKYHYGLYFRVAQNPIPIDFAISVMEIESWFIGEYSHFPKIDDQLTIELINQNLGIDVTTMNYEIIDKPSETLNEIYKLVNKSYSKNKDKAERTVNCLDYSRVYFELPDQISSLKNFIELVKERIA